MVMIVVSVVRTVCIPVWIVPAVPCHGIMVIRSSEIIVDTVTYAGGIP
jgi:hypothetical protein